MNSLPFLVRLVAASIVARQNQLLLAENAYQRVEIARLHAELGPNHRLRWTDEWRKRLAHAGAAVGWERLAQIATVAKASTIRGWHRLMARGRLGVRRTTGRPRTNTEIEAIVVRMAQENPTWGQVRIRGELMKLGVTLAARTIAAILNRYGLQPSPKRSTDWSWQRFVAEKADALVATDFFTVDVPRLFRTQTYYVLFFIHLATRQVRIAGITEHPTGEFMAQTARNLTMADTGWLKQVGCRYVIHDRDTKYCAQWQQVLASGGVETVPIPPRSPNLNAFAETWVHTVKRECVRRLRFLDYKGLWEVLHEFVDHHNRERPHQGRGNVPLPVAEQPLRATQKLVTPIKASQVRCVTRCRGVVRHYYRAAA